MLLPGIDNGLINLAYIVGMLVLCMGIIPGILYFGTARDDRDEPKQS